jgi:hypothetical protein
MNITVKQNNHGKILTETGPVSGTAPNLKGK